MLLSSVLNANISIPVRTLNKTYFKKIRVIFSADALEFGRYHLLCSPLFMLLFHSPSPILPPLLSVILDTTPLRTDTKCFPCPLSPPHHMNLSRSSVPVYGSAGPSGNFFAWKGPNYPELLLFMLQLSAICWSFIVNPPRFLAHNELSASQIPTRRPCRPVPESAGERRLSQTAASGFEIVFAALV